MYKLVVPTAGVGSRIGPYTKFKNKALVSVGLIPAIVKVIENFTDAQEIIILTGYEAESLKDVILSLFLAKCQVYPCRKLLWRRIWPWLDTAAC